MLSLRHKVFMEVARYLSFSKASDVLYISQPAVSKHIKELENHYKTTLFERKGNHILLTKAGTFLYEKLREARQIETTVQEILQQHSTEPGTALLDYPLGASTTIALYVIPPVLSAFLKENPYLQISLLNRNSESILEALTNHEIELAIVEGGSRMTHLVYTPFIEDEVIPVCSSHSKLAQNRTLTLDQLLNQRIALRERGSGTLAALRDALSEQNIRLQDLRIAIRMGGTEALKNFLLADDCIGFLSTRTVAKELQEGTLVPLSVAGLSVRRRFHFVQRKGNENHPLDSRFIQFARKYYRDR